MTLSAVPYSYPDPLTIDIYGDRIPVVPTDTTSTIPLMDYDNAHVYGQCDYLDTANGLTNPNCNYSDEMFATFDQSVTATMQWYNMTLID